VTKFIRKGTLVEIQPCRFYRGSRFMARVIGRDEHWPSFWIFENIETDEHILLNPNSPVFVGMRIIEEVTQ